MILGSLLYSAVSLSPTLSQDLPINRCYDFTVRQNILFAISLQSQSQNRTIIALIITLSIAVMISFITPGNCKGTIYECIIHNPRIMQAQTKTRRKEKSNILRIIRSPWLSMLSRMPESLLRMRGS